VPRPTSPRTASGVNMLEQCDESNLLYVLFAEEIYVYCYMYC